MKLPACGHYLNRAQRNCPECRAVYEDRLLAIGPEVARRRNAGKLARLALECGQLQVQPCERCGSKQVEMHHDDYAKPLQVRFLCRFHHQSLHGLYRKLNNLSVDKRQPPADTASEDGNKPQ